MREIDTSLVKVGKEGLNAKRFVAAFEHFNGIIMRFGRYPQRNKVLGRFNTAEEEIYLKQKQHESRSQRVL